MMRRLGIFAAAFAVAAAGFILLGNAAAALITGTSSGLIWLHSSARSRGDRSTGATKVRFRLSRAASAAAFSRERPVRTRATRVRT